MEKIDEYTIQSVIGTGGMGRVLKGIDPFGRQVAIKEILPEFVNNAEYRKRIDSEIKVMQALNDPNVVKVYRNFERDGRLYIVMELVDGINLEQYVMEKGVFTLDEAAKFMHKLLGTMQYVHKKKIIHRDIKPGNVMIRSNGEICVLDFGIAKDNSTEKDDDERTQIGTVLGTDGYMSPEQANGYGVDRRTDIYSLGCVMFYILTGRHAYMTYANDSDRTAAEICSKPFPRLADFRSDLPETVQQILDKSTEKNMLRRYQSCREFSDDITDKCENIPTPELTPEPGADTIPKNGAISIGRENCDITIPPGVNKVSRHHCDVELMQTSGGYLYRIIDHSTNGTLVNGRVLNKGQHVDLHLTDNPEIVLSSSPRYVLDWNLVKQKIKSKYGIPPHDQPEPPSNEEPKDNDVINIGNNRINVANDDNGKISGSKGMSFFGAVKSCFNKYAGFSGRASRSEYWYFCLFNFLIALVPAVSIPIFQDSSVSIFFMILGGLYYIAAILPSVAVTVRRLHDTDHSGFNILWSLLPVVGSIILLIFMVSSGTYGPNRYGPQPE